MSAVILSKGIFSSRVVLRFPNKFLTAVVDTMSHGIELSEEDWNAYVKEYMNIFFGRTISRINNELGKASRFIIPVIIRGEYRESGYKTFDESIEMTFKSEYGTIKIRMDYDLLPEFSSN